MNFLTEFDIVNATIKVLSKLRFTEPSVVPIDGGGLQLEWNVGSKHLELEFPNITDVVFLKDDNGIMDSGTVSVTEIDKIQDLLNWLTV